MITRITGMLNRVGDDEVRLQVGALEYQILVAEFVRRVVQMKIGHELAFHTIHFFDGNPMQGKVVPRLIGFPNENDLEFFELFCTVDKIGTRKALKALAFSPRDIAAAIQRQDTTWLTQLPGVGGPTAEKIITTLKRKVAKFAGPPQATSAKAAQNGTPLVEEAPTVVLGGEVLEEAFAALIALGHSPIEARIRLDRLLSSGKTYSSAEEVIRDIYGK